MIFFLFADFFSSSFSALFTSFPSLIQSTSIKHIQIIFFNWNCFMFLPYYWVLGHFYCTVCTVVNLDVWIRIFYSNPNCKLWSICGHSGPHKLGLTVDIQSIAIWCTITVSIMSYGVCTYCMYPQYILTCFPYRYGGGGWKNLEADKISQAGNIHFSS